MEGKVSSMPLLGLDGVRMLGQHIMVGLLDGTISKEKAEAAGDLLNRVLLPGAVARERPEKPSRQLARVTLVHRDRLMQIDVGEDDGSTATDQRQLIDEQGRTVQ